jgi:hypothetical protein
MGVHLSNNQIPNRNKMTATLHPPDDKLHLAQTEFKFVMLGDKRHAMQLATVDMHAASLDRHSMQFTVSAVPSSTASHGRRLIGIGVEVLPTSL